MIFKIFIFIFVYIIINLLGYLTHRAFHQKWSGFFYRAHHNHHYIQYPPNDFFSEAYRSAGKDNSGKFFILAFLPMIIGWFVFVFLAHISLVIGIGVIIEMVIIGLAHDILHDAFHIQNHWLNKFAIFRRWVELHKIHHIDVSKNYGIFDFLWDRVFGTFEK